MGKYSGNIKKVNKAYLALTKAPHNVVLTLTQVPDRNSEMLGWLRKQKFIPGT